jgi:hypothetical protein
MDNVLYTDGHNVKVTTSQFIVGRVRYLIDGILNARVNIIKANVAGAIILLLLGIAAAVLGYLRYFSSEQINTLAIGNWVITANRLAMIAGGFLMFCSLLWLLASHNRYAVHITTAEGEKDTIVSTKRDYVSQIVRALNRAIHPKTIVE